MDQLDHTGITPKMAAGSATGCPVVGQEAPTGQRTPLYTFWTIRITGSLVPGDTWEDRDLYIQEELVNKPWIEEMGIQREKGKKNGVMHYQGTVKLTERKRFSTLAALLKPILPNVAWDNTQGFLEKSISDKANRYVMKEDTRVAGPWYKGVTFDEIAKESVYSIDITLRPWQKNICKIIDAGADDRHIWWIWEPCGGAGKTTFQKWLFLNYKGVTLSGGKASDMKNGIIRYREACGSLPSIVLINLPMTFNLDYFCPHGVEEVKDMFFFSGKYGEKGADPIVCGRPPHVFVFANREPDTSNMAADRWRIARIPDGPGKRTSIARMDWSVEGPLDDWMG